MRRQRLGIKQNKLAELSGVSQSLIAKLEKARLEPSYSVAVKIFRALDSLEHKQEKKCKDIVNKKIVIVNKNDKVEKALLLMKKHSIDQMPIFSGEHCIGSISEALIFNKMLETDRKKLFAMRVEDVMKEPFPIVNSEMPVSIILPMLKIEDAVLVSKNRKIVGIITKSDVI